MRVVAVDWVSSKNREKGQEQLCGGSSTTKKGNNFVGVGNSEIARKSGGQKPRFFFLNNHGEKMTDWDFKSFS